MEIFIVGKLKPDNGLELLIITFYISENGVIIRLSYKDMLLYPRNEGSVPFHKHTSL